MKYHVLVTLGACAAFACSLPTAPASAAMPADLSSVDCSQSSSMMMKPDVPVASGDAMKSDSAMTSMTTDQAFDATSHDMMHRGAVMAGIELKCGKDAKSRAAAAKLLMQLRDDGMAEAQQILNTYNH